MEKAIGKVILTILKFLLLNVAVMFVLILSLLGLMSLRGGDSLSKILDNAPTNVTALYNLVTGMLLAISTVITFLFHAIFFYEHKISKIETELNKHKAFFENYSSNVETL